MTTHFATKARCWPQKHRSGNVTWKVRVGKKIDGKPDVRSFPTQGEAEAFRDLWNSKLLANDSASLSDLSGIQKHEILAALEKLKAFNATLPEAVEFFLKHARPAKGQITVSEAVTLFLEVKSKAGRSAAYLRSCSKTFFPPFAQAFEGRNLSDIAQHDAEAYVNSHKEWNGVSRNSHLSYLTTLFNFLMKRGYVSLNPFAHIERSHSRPVNPKVVTPETAKKLLQVALDSGHKAECASMVLVFFCGIRVNEVSRLSWEQVNLKEARIAVSWEAAKTRSRRVNIIPPNALEWLTLCAGTGRIAPNDYEQRMKRLRARANVEYPQNAMRHSFASYHIAQSQNAAETAILLGHPNASLLYRNYRELVSVEDASKYFEIIPDSAVAKRDEEAAIADAEAKAEAEELSNCRQAIKGEDGDWHPLMDEGVSFSSESFDF